MYLFPVATVTNHHNLNDSKQHKYYYLTALELRSPHISVRMPAVLQEDLGKSHFLAFFSF